MTWLKRLTGKEEPETENVPAEPTALPTSPPMRDPDPLSDLPGHDPEPANGVHVGESPVPGLTLRRILRGHTDAINRIAWSPDGRFLASPSNDQTIRIWDVVRGECTAVMEGHKHWVNSVTWSPDGHRLASGSSDNTIRIWDTETWKTLTVLEGHKSRVNSVAWSPRGEILASGGTDDSIRLWETETWTCLQTVKANANHNVWGIAWSPSKAAETLASGLARGDIVLWDANLNVIRTLKGTKAKWVVVWSSDGSMLASCSWDTNVHIWDLKAGSQEIVLEAHTKNIPSVAFSNTGLLLSSKSLDGTFRLWRTDTWETVAVLQELQDGKEPSGSFSSLAFHPHLPLQVQLQIHLQRLIVVPQHNLRMIYLIPIW